MFTLQFKQHIDFAAVWKPERQRTEVYCSVAFHVARRLVIYQAFYMFAFYNARPQLLLHECSR